MEDFERRQLSDNLIWP